MEFCKGFNARTQDMTEGRSVPGRDHLLSRQVLHVRDQDAAGVLPDQEGREDGDTKKKPGSGSKKPGVDTVGKITMAQCKEIAQAKQKDLNAADLDQAAKMIAGTARSMGVEVVG